MRGPADWFEDLMGFKELRYAETRANLEVVGSTLRSKVNQRAYSIGTLETPSLAELRRRAASIVGASTGALRVSNVVGDVFCSALPVAYSRIPATRWQAFATLVLEAAYEATLWAAVINTHRTTSNVVYLTRVGGGAFGNETVWIEGAIRRSLKTVAGTGLDVGLVRRGEPDRERVRLVGEFR